MKSSLPRFLLSAVLAFACAAAVVANAFREIGSALRNSYVAVKDWAIRVIDHGLQLAAGPTPGAPAAITKPQFQAFVQRIVKRERPVITQSWRACPSV